MSLLLGKDSRGLDTRGRALLVARESANCVLCHALPDAAVRFAGNVGPSLAAVGTRLTPAQLRQLQSLTTDAPVVGTVRVTADCKARIHLPMRDHDVAMIELDEGVRMMSNLVDVPADPDHVKVGMPVEIVYDKVNDEITLPKFRPRQG